MYGRKSNRYRFYRLTRKSPQGEYDVAPSEESCPTRISPSHSEVKVSATEHKRRLLSEINKLKETARHRAMRRLHEFAPKLQKQSKRYQKMLAEFEADELEKCWEQIQTLERKLQHLMIRVERQDYRRLLTTEPDYFLTSSKHRLSKGNGQLTIFSDDEPPDPDDFKSLEEFERAWKRWELQYPELAEAVRQSGRKVETIRVEQKSLTIPVEQKPHTETAQSPSTQTIKCLTLKQPWAWAIFNLGKDIENRIWRDDYRGLLYIHAGIGYDEYGKAWIEENFNISVPSHLESGCILGSVELVEISRDSFNSPWAMAHQWHWKLENPVLLKAPIEARGDQKLWNLETQPENLQTQGLWDIEPETLPESDTAEQKSPKTTVNATRSERNTKPGRGSRPRAVNCNVKRNGSKGKNPNTYWVYKFSFKVDGKYYNRSCSIPKEKVNRVIEMWESQQYSWQDIVDFIGRDSDRIMGKTRGKNDENIVSFSNGATHILS